MSNSSRRALGVCLAVAVLLRLTFVFFGFPYLEPRLGLREDGDGYGIIAQSIREGRYDDLTRGPVYPALVALAGSSRTMKILQALLDTATCGLIYRLTSRAFHPSAFVSAPLAAAWLWAVYPFAIWRVAFLNKEVVLTFLLAGYVSVQLLARRDGRAWQWLAAGALLGVVNLCKPSFLLWPVVLRVVCSRSVSFGRGSRFGYRFGLLIAAMMIVIAPWTYRNWRVSGGEFLPVATEAGGLSTFVGNYQPTLGLWEGAGKLRWQAAVDEIKMQNTGASVIELDRAFYRAAWRQVTGNPLKAVELVLRKCGRFWFLSAARRQQVASGLIQLAYLSLAGIGLWRLRPWGGAVGLMVALIGYGMFIHALSYADLRFSLPVMPLICALGAAGIATRRPLP